MRNSAQEQVNSCLDTCFAGTGDYLSLESGEGNYGSGGAHIRVVGVMWWILIYLR